MFDTYLKAAWRNIIKKKWQSFLNIGGLAIGMAATLLIAIWVHYEVTFNEGIRNHERIAQVMQSQNFAGEINTAPNQPLQLAPVLRNDYADYFEHVVTSSFTGDMLLTLEDKKIMRSGNFMEPGITHLLSLEMTKGTKEALEDPTSMLISESTALALFGEGEAMGQTIGLATSMQATVAGVYADLPQNTEFADLKFIAPWDLLKGSQGYQERLGWGNNWFQVYVQLAEGADPSIVSEAIKDAKYDNAGTDDPDIDKSRPVISLHPMERWHLYSKFENGISTDGAIERVRLFGIIGFFILLLACINFVNLSTARSIARAKEVGIRKTIGSVRHQLITQFLTESMMVVVLAFVLALSIVLLSGPFFNDLTGKSVGVPYGEPWFWAACSMFVVLTGLLSGCFPAFYLSNFRPAKVLKGKFDRGNGAGNLRRVLVVFQFTISVILVIGTLTVFRQLQHVEDRPVGYDREQLLYVPINTSKIITGFETLRTELMESPFIKEVAASDVLITDMFVTNSGFEWNGKEPSMNDQFTTLRTTYGYGDMVDWELTEGRGFSRSFASDSLAFIINETAAKYMGLENPVGEYVQWGNNGSYKIIGVVKDMVTQSPYDAVQPSIFTLHYGNFLNYVNIKLAGGENSKAALAHIESVFERYDPKSLFSYNFLDEQYAKKFREEKRTGRLASLFAVLAILISCLGVFGLSAFVAEQRTKEIGIRKVLGASVFGLWKMLSKDFVVLVAISCFIAVPIGYYYMDGWLDGFAYRTEISWGILAFAVLAALIITLLTVSFQSIKAASVDPVRSLRSE